MGSCASTTKSSASQVASAEDFDFVHPSPSNLLVDSISPGTKPRQVYNLNIEENGRITYSSDGAEFSIQITNQEETSSTCMILEDTNTNQVLAILQRGTAVNSWHIFALKPCYQGQQPTTTNNQTFQGKQLYEWAVVKYHAGGAGGSGYSLHARDPKSSATCFAQPASHGGLRVRRGKEFCALIGPKRRAHSSSSPYRNIKIAPGIDPALFLCYSAIVQKMVLKGYQTTTNRLENGEGIVGAANDILDIVQLVQ